MKLLAVLLVVVAATSSTFAMTLKAVEYVPTERCKPFAGNKNITTAAQQRRADALITAFEKAYPPGLVDPLRVETTTVLPATLKAIVVDLACLSTHPGADPFIPGQAAALFASKRYGKGAFAFLAKAGNARFAQQMRVYIAIHR